jgi:Flp pilus assembly pilin Flp
MLSIFTMALAWIRMSVRSERGQDLIEYAMIGGVVATIIAGGAFIVISGALDSFANGIADCIDFDSSTACSP